MQGNVRIQASKMIQVSGHITTSRGAQTDHESRRALMLSQLNGPSSKSLPNTKICISENLEKKVEVYVLHKRLINKSCHPSPCIP